MYEQPVEWNESKELVDMAPFETGKNMQAMTSMEAREVALDTEVITGTSTHPSLTLQYDQHISYNQASTAAHV